MEDKNFYREEDGERMDMLVSEYYDNLYKGCLTAPLNIFRGTYDKYLVELCEITNLNESEVRSALITANSYFVRSKTKEQAYQKLLTFFNQGNSSDDPANEDKVVRAARLSRSVVDKLWAIRDERDISKNN